MVYNEFSSVQFIIIITCICVQWVAMVFLVYREGMQLPLVAMVLREASALMRISSNYYYLYVQWVAMVFLVYREGLACSCLYLREASALMRISSKIIRSAEAHMYNCRAP